ncbi:Peroxidase stcC-like protein [Cladobotryum mycophilum]|uniref:Peroxidase stcC-like protein n=1 Tax=Cladobotryum mycophilum TaxID=491253 RepID=A0ABR0SC87_9HYPO
MKSQIAVTFLLPLLASGYSLANLAEPTLNPNDPRFKNWKPGGSGDSRSSCPGLNSLANHGFLPHDGKRIDAVSIVRASFQGFGMSPALPAILILKGLKNADLLTDGEFNLHDIDRRSWGIWHADSLSRENLPPGGDDLPPAETSRFQDRPWNVALTVMKNCGGRGNYDMTAAGHGAVESAMLMLALGDKNGADLRFIKEIFEMERLPRQLGWQPKAFAAAIDNVLDDAAQMQNSDKVLRCTSNGRVASRLDMIKALEPNSTGFTGEVEQLLKQAGFNRQSIFDNLERIDKER